MDVNLYPYPSLLPSLMHHGLSVSCLRLYNITPTIFFLFSARAVGGNYYLFALCALPIFNYNWPPHSLLVIAQLECFLACRETALLGSPSL